MSLFVGNISKNVRLSELEDEFFKFGRCEIKQHVSKLNENCDFDLESCAKL